MLQMGEYSKAQSGAAFLKYIMKELVIRHYTHTIHKPTTIWGDVSFGNYEIKVTKNLHHFQQYPWLVHAVNLSVT